MGLTTNFKIPYPEDNDVADVPGDLKKLAEKTDESLKSLIDLIYPVGRGFIDFTNTDYSNWLGLTWQRELVGMFPVGYNPNDTSFDTIGEKGGEKTHTLTEAEMPSHTHIQNAHSHTITVKKGAGSGGSTTPGLNNNVTSSSDQNYTSSSVTATNQNTGGSQPHNNLPPYQVVSYWKRVDPNAKTMISFSIYTREYEAEEGMTFYEWVNSSYNTDGWKAESEGDYVTNDILSPGKVLYVNAPGGGAYLLSSETIIADYVYSQYAEK